MLALLAAVLSGALAGCAHFEHYPAPADTQGPAFVASYTRKGIASFAYRGIEMAEAVLEKAVIPNVYMPFETVLGTIEITMRNIRLSDFSLGTLQFALRAPDDDCTQIRVEGFTLRTLFDYSFLKRSFPVLNESGWADISVSGSAIFADLRLVPSDACPDHSGAVVNNVSVGISDLVLDFDSPFANLLKPFIPFIKAPLIELLEGVFAETMAPTLNRVINETMGEFPDAYPELLMYASRDGAARGADTGADADADAGAGSSPAAVDFFFMDQRQRVFRVEAEHVSACYPGLTYYAQVARGDHNTVLNGSLLVPQEGPAAPLPLLVNGDDVQFILDRAAFNSALRTWHAAARAYDGVLASTDAPPGAAGEYVSLAGLEAAFPGVTRSLPSDAAVRLSYAHAAPPRVVAVAPAGLHTRLCMRAEVCVVEPEAEPAAERCRLLLAFAFDVDAVGRPAMHEHCFASMNVSSFYLELSFGSLALHEARAGEGVAADLAHAEGYLEGLFVDALAPAFAERMKERSFLSENTLFLGALPRRVTYFPPEYCAVTLSYDPGSAGRPQAQ